jgi:glycosyltransferase involved in cell wall biosynthesis
MGGCGHVRLRWPVAELQRCGHDVTVYEDLPGVWRRGEIGEPNVLVDITDVDADLVVLQRVFRPEMLAFQRLLRKRGIAVAIDIDDDLLAVHPRHPAFPLLEPCWGVLREAYREADMVTTSTPALAKRYGGSGRARVVPNGIPKGYLDIPRPKPRQVPIIGWTGVVGAHEGDLEQVGASVADLCRSGAARVRTIGGGREALDVLRTDGEFHPGAPLNGFHYARLYADFDAALVPLRESRFNAGKSWLKGLEAAALGVPFVASPTPEYVRLNGLGAGLLAESPKDWRVLLKALASSSNHREDLGAQGRIVASRLTTEDYQAPQLWDAWSACIHRTKGGKHSISIA